MALQTSGQISLANIATEFGDSAPHSLSEFYGSASGIPSSGQISISDFYGVSSFNGLPNYYFDTVNYYNLGDDKIVITGWQSDTQLPTLPLGIGTAYTTALGGDNGPTWIATYSGISLYIYLTSSSGSALASSMTQFADDGTARFYRFNSQEDFGYTHISFNNGTVKWPYVQGSYYGPNIHDFYGITLMHFYSNNQWRLTLSGSDSYIYNGSSYTWIGAYTAAGFVNNSITIDFIS